MSRWLVGLILFAGVACGSEQPSAIRADASTVTALPARLQADLAFASYWGSPGGSALRSAVFDTEGNLYIAGGTENPAQWPQTASATGPLGFFDVIVAKFDPSGRNLWSVVIGGPGEDYAYVSALDRDGNLLVGGRGGPEFPVTSGAFDASFNGGMPVGPHGATDGFLLSLTPGGALRWATYIGTSGDDIIRGIELLASGSIAVSGGMMEADDLPTTAGVLKPKSGGAKDAWVAVVKPDGSALEFLTYFGPSDDHDLKEDETLRAIGRDPGGNLWLAGTTQGTDLAASADAFQPRRGGGTSAFVAKLSPDGTRMPYFSWLGGGGNENVETEGFSDAAGGFYIAGGTTSDDFPATAGASARGSNGDGWVARIEPDGRLGMAARFGGSGRENFFGPALDAAGNLFASATSLSADVPVTSGVPQPAFGGGRSDALLVGFDRRGALAFSTYFGGSGDDMGRFVASDPARSRVVLIGETTSRDLLLRNAAQPTPGAVYFAVFELKPAAAAAPATPPAPQ